MECRGRIYKMRTSLYLSNESLISKTCFVPMKRMSCSGCEDCSYLCEYLPEFASHGTGICWKAEDEEEGALFRLDVGNASTDYETGIVDDWDLVFTKLPKEVD